MMEMYARLAEAGPGERAVTRALCGAQQWMREATAEELMAWTRRREGLTGEQPMRLKIALRQAANAAPAGTPPFANPYHWAPFRVVGD